jgi:hypothetical protein
MRRSSPLLGGLIEGTVESGARSETEDKVRCKRGLLSWYGGGEEERIPVVDVGIGVGYFRYAASCWGGGETACLFEGRGKPGEEEYGSKAGSRDGAGRFTPAVAGNEGCISVLLGEESILIDINKLLPN